MAVRKREFISTAPSRYHESNKKYYEENQERLREAARQRYHADPERSKENNKRWLSENPGYRRNEHLRRNYGISNKDYLEMFRKQHGRCGICRDYHDVLCVDHNHKTGEVRGLLCTNCNLKLGWFEKHRRTAERWLG